MLWTLLLIYLLRSASADAADEVAITPRCSDAPLGMTLTAVEGYAGRYTVTLCTHLKPTAHNEKWKLRVSFYKMRDYCNPSMKDSMKLLPGKTHSINEEFISKNHTCTSNQTACMSAQFDMIFSACYSISNILNETSSREEFYYFDVVNAYTEELFHKNRAYYELENTEDYMLITWHTGVPPSVYKVEISNSTNLDSPTLVTNCSITDISIIKCYLKVDYGCYTVHLRHNTPWIVGIFHKQESVPFEICRRARAPGPALGAAAAPAWRWAAAAGGAAAALLLLLAACALAARRSTALATNERKEYLRRYWLNLLSGREAAEAARPPGRHVLLLYAREGPAGRRAAHALRDALQHVISGQVFDIYSPAVMAACAAAPGAWLRGAVARRDVRVVLLQSPALHCLHSAQLADDSGQLKLASPLLGRRVLPREPQFGDALLQLALRLVSENVLTRDDYNKFYIATIPELPTELLPWVEPYRRYELPEKTSLLLRDVSSAGQVPDRTEHIDTFARLLAEFVQHARDNPDYLMEELMLVDS